MRAAEILGEGQPLLEMSVNRRKAEQIVSGLEQPINLHLLKLLGCNAEEATRNHWKRELNTWLLRIAALTLKPHDRPIPEKIVFQWLYDETFGGREVQNVEMMLSFVARDYPRNTVDGPTISKQLQNIHTQLAKKISENNPGEDIISSL